MDLRQMEVFVAVAEEGSIHAAARRLFLSQPAISQAMRKLERVVGAPLLVRSPRGVELTEPGRVFLDQARLILRSVDDAVAEARRVGRRRRIRVGLLSGHLGAGELTPLIVGEYRRAHPDVDVSVADLSFGDQFEAVSSGDVDVAIVRAQREYDGLDFTPLFNEPRVLCYSAEAAESAGAEPVTADALLDMPVLNLVHTPDRWSSFWELQELRQPYERVRSTAVTISELQSAIAGSKCVLSVALSGWRLGIRNPLLRALPIEGTAPTIVQAAYRRGADQRTALEFAEFARGVVAENLDIVEGAHLAA
ncbi:LysR family transcriptional regulator [Tsukamurella soli]